MPGQSMLTKQLADPYYSNLPFADQSVLLYTEGRMDAIAKRYSIEVVADGETFCHHVDGDRLDVKLILTSDLSSEEYDSLLWEVQKIFGEVGFRIFEKEMKNDLLIMRFAFKRTCC